MSGSAPSAGPSKGWRRSPAAQQQHPSSAQVAPAPGDEMTQPAPAVAAKFKSNRLAELKRSSTLGAPAAAAAAASGSLQDLKVQKEQQRPSSSSAASRSQEASRNQLLLLAQNQHVQQEQQQCQVPGPGHHPQAMQFSTMQLDYGANQAPLHIQGPVYSHQNQHHTSASIQPQHALQQYQNQHQHQHQSTSQMSKGHTTDSSSLALSSEQCTDGEHEDRPSCVQIMKKLFFSLVLGIVIAICWVMIIHTLKWIAIRGNEYELVNQQQQSPLHHHRSSAGVQSLAALGAPPTSALSSSPSDVFQRRRAAQDEPSALDQVAGSSAAGTGDPTSGAEINLQVAAAGERVTRQSSENDNGSDNDDNGESYESVRRPAELAKQSASGGENSGMSQGAARGQQVARPSQASGRLGARPQLQLQPISTRQSFADGGRVTALNNRQRPPSSPAAAGSGPLPPLMVLDFGANNQEESLKSETSVEPASKQVSFASTGLEPSLEGSPEDEGLAAGGAPGSSLSLESRGLAPVAGLVYRAPFFTSWFVSIWNILFMPVFTLISSCCFRNEDSTTKKLLVESINQFMDNGLTTLQFLGRCAFFSVLWIGTIFGIVYSLSNIDATVVMALFACSAALVYLLSWVLLHQQFVGVRIVAVIICTTGIALLAYMDNSRTLGSVLIVAGSALCSAVYKVIYQRMFGFWSIAQMSLFFTLIGLFNAFLMWPVALMLYFLGAELIVWRYIPWMHLTAAGALHLTANIIAYFGPICSYDIFLTMGLLVAVVLSAVIDVTFYKITFFGMKLAGVLLLMVGFLVCLLPENWNEFLYDLVNERFVRWKKQRNLKKSRNKVQDLSTGQMSRLRTPSGRVK